MKIVNWVKTRRVLKSAILAVVWVGVSQVIQAQSPANLLSDVNASHGFTTTTAIENTFNNGRRQEESQLGLPVNSITNLDLPSDAVWDDMSDEAKMLYLLNDERTSRAGINYGAGPVKGLPFAGVAQGVDNVSNNYAQTLFQNDAFTHTYGGTSPSSRLGAVYNNTCKEFTSRSENLYASVHSANTGFPRAVEKAVYGFNYDDAGSAWGHREMCLLQDLNLQGQSWGFNNNEGSTDSEGYIGVGVYRGTNYGGFGSNWPYGVVLALNYIDPSPSCTYTIIEAGDIGPSDPVIDPCSQPLTINSTSDISVHSSDHSVTLEANASFITPTTISSPEVNINAGFSIEAGTCLQVVNAGCAYNASFDCDIQQSQGPIAGIGSCSSPYIISCNESHNSTNSNRTNQWSGYGNQSGWTGGEVIYKISLPAGANRIITLSGLTEDLDMFLASSCSASSTLSGSTSIGLANESLNILTQTSGDYYIIIDGWDDAVSSFTLYVSCTNGQAAKPVSNKSMKSISKERAKSMVGKPHIADK